MSRASDPASIDTPRWTLASGQTVGALLATALRDGAVLSSVPSRDLRPEHFGAAPDEISGFATQSNRALKAAKVDARPHDLRRTYISTMVEHTDLLSVSTLAGHSDPATTKRYDLRPAAGRAAAVQALEKWGTAPAK